MSTHRTLNVLVLPRPSCTARHLDNTLQSLQNVFPNLVRLLIVHMLFETHTIISPNSATSDLPVCDSIRNIIVFP